MTRDSLITKDRLEAAIASLDAQPGMLNADVLKTSQAALQAQLDSLNRQRAINAALKGERRQITVMFADISGFTAMSEKLDPEEVRNLINACFEQLGAVINRYDGYIDKFIGDEIMALFGAPTAHENDPERALRTALDMMSALDDFNTHHSDKLPKPLALHFGINTGLVIAGGIGTRARQDYSVMGDAVNLAARLEDLSEADEILVGEATVRPVGRLFEFEALPPVSVKGKEKPVRVYRLLGASAERGQIRGIEGLTSPLVGRTAEMAILRLAQENVRQGRGGVVAIVGDAGMGKSRLVQELQAEALSAQVVWARGHGLSYAQSASYLVARDVLCSLLGLSIDTSPTTLDTVLRHEINRLAPDQFSEIYPYVARMMELPLDEAASERVKYLDGDALHQQISLAVQQLLDRRGQEAPLALIWDDLHWADPSSLRLLETLIPLVQDRPILHLLVYRPLRQERIWAFHQQVEQAGGILHTLYQSIDLLPLTIKESTQLVENLMGSDPNTTDLRAQIIRKAEGNPFYMEEVIRSLIDGGTLVCTAEDANCFTTTSINEITIPDTLQGVIMARIDQLDPETKRTLQVAAVIGRNFPEAVLAEVVQKLT